MRVPKLHRWGLTPKAARDLQLRLRDRVERADRFGDVRLVAGVDVSVKNDRATAAVVVLRASDLEPIEQRVHIARCAFPYVPGLLAFRELPAILGAFEKVENAPDLVLADGQGTAHPRRFGIACHLGLWLDLPSIGCGKTLLCGEHAEPAAKAGSHTPLVEKGEVIGAAVRTKDRTNVVYVSVGHRVSLPAAIRWTLRLTNGYRLPEPTRLADRAAGGATLVPKLVQGGLF